MKNGAIGVIVLILAVVVLFWVLKIAFKLALLAAVVVGAAALFYAVRNRIGGPRA